MRFHNEQDDFSGIYPGPGLYPRTSYSYSYSYN